MKQDSQHTTFRIRRCLKCQKWVVLSKAWFLCEKCRNTNSHTNDDVYRYRSHVEEVVRSIRLGSEKIRE